MLWYVLIDVDAIPTEDKELFGIFVTNLMKSAPDISLTFKSHLTLVLLLHYSKVKKDFPEHSLIVVMERAMPAVIVEKDKKLEEWENFVRRQFVHKNNVFMSDPSFLSGDFSISTSTIREQHVTMIHKIDQLGCDVMALDSKMSTTERELTRQVVLLKDEIVVLKNLVVQLCHGLHGNRAIEPDIDEGVSPRTSSSSSRKRPIVEGDESETTTKKLRSCTILDGFSGISMSTAFFQFYTENLPKQVKAMIGSGYTEQRSNYTKIHRVVTYMKRFQEVEMVIEKKPAECDNRKVIGWISGIRDLAGSLEEKAFNWLKTQGNHRKLTKSCKSCESLLTQYKQNLPVSNCITDNFVVNVINDELDQA